MDRLMWVALAAPLLLVGMVAMADDHGQGTQPAVPGGGNSHANSANAATPAVPGHEPDLDVDHLDDHSANDMADQDPGIGQAARTKWESMTPDERKAWAKAHPRLARAIAKARWDEMTPAERGDFLRTHPEVRERLIARWRALTPEQRQDFLRRHPQLRRRMAARRMNREHEDHGVRDHGAGEGRNGAGQGGEHRQEHPAPRH